ncbi:hypothetical protein TEPIDINF_001344 [Tepidibacillus infernus]|uniref:hypothetical protein n=1 Tax=Tepidibacillus TaxID=1494427 RepID=UPI000857F9D1|nr:hypothetical protein [Tepidibacillus sp. HK-1]GBF12315.1 hypothetical protein HK1_02376 [Tepidibacillus sp. HK-1]
MAIKTDSIPTYLDEFRMIKLDSMIRDVKKLNPEELLKIKNEIEKLLFFEDQHA